jgi:hypothetical protein
MEAEPQRIEERARAQHAIVPGYAPRHVGERIRRVGDHEPERLRRGGDDPRHDVAVDARIGGEQAQAARGIVAVGGAARLLVGARRDHHDRGIAQVGVLPGAQVNGRREDGPILKIDDRPFRALGRAIDQHDLARRPAQCHGEEARGPHRARADDADLHVTPS